MKTAADLERIAWYVAEDISEILGEEPPFDRLNIRIASSIGKEAEDSNRRFYADLRSRHGISFVSSAERGFERALERVRRLPVPMIYDGNAIFVSDRITRYSEHTIARAFAHEVVHPWDDANHSIMPEIHGFLERKFLLEAQMAGTRDAAERRRIEDEVERTQQSTDLYLSLVESHAEHVRDAVVEKRGWHEVEIPSRSDLARLLVSVALVPKRHLRVARRYLDARYLMSQAYSSGIPIGAIYSNPPEPRELQMTSAYFARLRNRAA